MFSKSLKTSLVFSVVLSLTMAGTFAASKPKPKFQPNPKKLNPPPGIVVPPQIKAELSSGAATLGREIQSLKASLKSRPELLELLPDVEIFYNAVKYAVDDDIFFSEKQFNSARNLLKMGAERAKELRAGKPSWVNATGAVVRGYVSRLDGSVQPYGVIIPETYKPGHKPMRLDYWLHGRGDTLSELAFIDGRLSPKSAFLPPDTIVLHPYGRFMNAFKFAGEADIFEALASVKKHYPIDDKRICMRGFSMGGAGTWHLGVHHADEWVAVNPGAGFVDVKNYQKLGDKLDTIPWYEQKLWSLYDPLAAPINLINTTLVAYSGEIDGQKAAADMMEAALAKEGIKMTHIIGPKTGHKYEPNAQKVVAKLVDEAAEKGIITPRKVVLVTYTLKWNKMHWVTLDSLEKHWDMARIEAENTGKGITVRTKNIAAFSLDNPGSLSAAGHFEVDGQDVIVTSRMDWPLHFAKSSGRWQSVASVKSAGLAKHHDLQGPIDDAFMDSFIMVRPTRPAMNAAVGRWVSSEMKEALFQWRHQLRGEAIVKNDSAISEADIKDSNLILWGDLSSNQVLAKIADQLPIKWTAKGIQVNGKTYDANKDVPVLIYPNPLNPKRYVVINSGFTFANYGSGSNSQQTPKLPDWAILDMSVPTAQRLGSKGVVDANFFGEKWELTAAHK